MVLSLDSHHAQAERFRRQAAMPGPRRKRLWRSIVQDKIRAQAAVLEEVLQSDEGLRALVPRVRSGDPDNVEARAARRYWSKLFPDGRFRRRDGEDVRNARLNYGYAVLRSVTARAVCGAGLHPSFGLFHSNAYNPFALADDLMEPFRPLIDLVAHAGQETELSPETKHKLIGVMLSRYSAGGEERTLVDILTRVAHSLARIVMGGREALWLPEVTRVRPSAAD
jgi:CRISPR-associated protein Cas1